MSFVFLSKLLICKRVLYLHYKHPNPAWLDVAKNVFKNMETTNILKLCDVMHKHEQTITVMGETEESICAHF